MESSIFLSKNRFMSGFYAIFFDIFFKKLIFSTSSWWILFGPTFSDPVFKYLSETIWTISVRCFNPNPPSKVSFLAFRKAVMWRFCLPLFRRHKLGVLQKGKYQGIFVNLLKMSYYANFFLIMDFFLLSRRVGPRNNDNLPK